MKPRRILVTGGTGFLGSALVRRMLKDGHQVRVFDDNSRGRPRRIDDIRGDIEVVEGDVRDYASVRRATEGVSAVAHLAFINGTEFFYSKPKLVLEVGVKGALNTLDAAIELGVQEYFLMSSSEVYQSAAVVPTDETAPFSVPDPLNPRYSYAGGKMISELLAINYARESLGRVVIVRPHNVYGPDMGWEHVIPQFALRAHDAVEAHPTGRVPFPIRGDGTQTRAFVHIDDFTEGAYLAFMEGETQSIYHVGTQDEITVRGLVEEVMRTFGREADVQPSEAPAGETSRRCPSIAKIRKLGYAPVVSLREGLKATVDWYVKNRSLRQA